MNKNLPLTKGTFVILYAKYKEFSVPILVIVVCLLLFYYVVLAQIQDIYAVQAEEEVVKNKIENLNKNVSFLNVLQTNVVTSHAQLLSAALPLEKDFVSILNAISQASAATGVTLGDFDLTVGDLSTQSAKVDAKPMLTVSLHVNGQINAVKDFISKLSEAFPLADVISVAQTNTSANIQTVFYYKPLSIIQFNKEQVLRPLTKEETDMISTLDTWRTGIIVPATQSASIVPLSASPSATQTP